MGNFGREKRFDSRRSFSDKRSFGDRRDSGPRASFKAICDECGEECTLPFKPTNNKPVFCSNCFAKQNDSDGGRRDDRRSGRRDDRRDGRRDDRRSFGDREMYKITCDICGSQAEVPFKPTPGKPILCDDCFKQNKSGGSRNSSADYSSQFNSLSEKLDKIIKLLSKNNTEDTKEIKTKEEKPAVKKEAKKKEVAVKEKKEKKAVAKKETKKKTATKKK
jgi:CxxC-x17-CxxC domain-containing protein